MTKKGQKSVQMHTADQSHRLVYMRRNRKQRRWSQAGSSLWQSSRAWFLVLCLSVSRTQRFFTIEKSWLQILHKNVAALNETKKKHERQQKDDFRPRWKRTGFIGKALSAGAEKTNAVTEPTFLTASLQSLPARAGFSLRATCALKLSFLAFAHLTPRAASCAHYVDGLYVFPTWFLPIVRVRKLSKHTSSSIIMTLRFESVVSVDWSRGKGPLIERIPHSAQFLSLGIMRWRTMSIAASSSDSGM